MGISDAHLKALGRLTAEFSRLEHEIATVAWFTSGDPTGAMIFTAHLSFSRLCDATVALAKKKTRTLPALACELEQITGRARALAGERNRLIHSIWVAFVPSGPAPEPGSPLGRVKITARGKLDIQLDVNFPAEKINHIVDEIEQTTKEVLLFKEKVKELLGPRSPGGAV